MGFRSGIDMSTNTLKGKLPKSPSDIKDIIQQERNKGKFSSRSCFGASLETFFGLGLFSMGFCIDAGKSFRSKDYVKTSNENYDYKITANSWTLGTYGTVGLNFSLFRLLLFFGPHGQYMRAQNTADQTEIKEWQWIPMIGIGPQVRLGIMIVELRYMHPGQFNLFRQGKNSIKDRLVFNKKGAGQLSLAALIRI